MIYPILISCLSELQLHYCKLQLVVSYSWIITNLPLNISCDIGIHYIVYNLYIYISNSIRHNNILHYSICLHTPPYTTHAHTHIYIYIYMYVYIVIVILFWWSPSIPSRNLYEVFTYNHIWL